MPAPEVVRAIVAAALAEDRALEDVTTLATVDANLRGTARFLAKQDGVLAGMGVALETFRQIDSSIALATLVQEGEAFPRGTVLAEVSGPVRAILQGERVALNFLQRLSATATLTRAFVAAIAGTRAVILDTRKTTPGLRDLEKYAVRCGGGTNHRRDLAVMAMIKDNHREALAREGRSLADGVATIRKRTAGIPVEVEIDSLDQLDAALAADPEWILLDNMATADMAEAVRRTGGRAKLEASGGVNLDTVRAIAGTGVDAISVGALTHSARALDISLDLEF
ncbi:MAG: carboxylating nicotinate-nucleotide diphosphorylase [Chloroflexi bacterium]|nr:carboxylating nicotinate-nucleotide diphosphorylase [Dehalococcoidia bacterium]NJD64553.1 carboxylating nicotinate-nucleotide diphosphorylase [Chloroflexota bacterium]PWB43268.1 MAG: nicotinate-nucleotide diphosphorylase (carboxylating) [Dehalococcoidia bacterium]